MTLKLKNRKEIAQYIGDSMYRFQAMLIYRLEYLVSELTNHAKIEKGYGDITSNLRSSIGGVVLKDGKPITYRGFVSEGRATVGDSTGLEFINSLIAQNQSGYAVIIVAGMEYASYVENYHNLNVLKKTELKMNAELPRILETLKKKFNESTTAV